LALVIAAALVETLLPNALAALLGSVRLAEGKQTVLLRLGVFLGTYLGNAALASSSWMIYNRFETRVFKALVDDAFSHIHRLPEQFFANTFTGAIVSKINRARTKIETFEDQIILGLLPTAVVLVGTIGFMAMRFPGLAALIAAYVCVLGTASAFFVFRVSGPAQSDYAAEQDRFSAHLADAVSGISTTKSFARETVEVEEFFGATERLRVKNARAYVLSNLTGLLQRLLLAGMLALMLGGGVWYLFRGDATVESIAYLAFAYTIVESDIRGLGEQIKNLLTASYDLHAVIWILREKPESPHEARLAALNIQRGEIEFDGVEFTYPGKKEPIFDQLSVTIRAGERVALVGHSGSGKTTFVRLLQMLYPVAAGRILIDGQDTAAGSRHSLRAAISLVPQDPVLFHRSLRENIAYARTGATLEEVREAARLAHIDSFIERLPDGYETLVGERGVKLSGGERQRVAIARAILADRPILILDEATSSLDSASERAIQDALHTLTHGRTSIMIAHRLSTILEADRILVFEGGHIVEQGTHSELIEMGGGIYEGFFRLQSGGFIAD
jgi:ATP-binding cassette subfamily B protein